MAGETSDMDTDNLQSAAEPTVSRDSMTLSLLDDVGGMVIQDSFPEAVHLDIAGEGHDTIEGKDEPKQSTTITNICG